MTDLKMNLRPLKQMKLLQLSVASNLIAAPAPMPMVNHGTIHNTDNNKISITLLILMLLIIFIY